MQLNLVELTPQTFLAEYWQQQPLVIRQGLPGFEDLLTPDEVAGLAGDERVESRRVYQAEGQWQAEFGPFDSYQQLGESGWTLIVQALNNWLPEANRLIGCFDFIPRWRLDDVMVSYATPGGGVGPHIDRYDVFICQGSGRRRWRVGDRGAHIEYAAHPALLHTAAFDALIEVELLPGDILYIPPGFPHDGISLDHSMSFSVGYRTASARDMHSALADYLIDNELADQQIEDAGRLPATQPGLIDVNDFTRIKQQLLDCLDEQLISAFAGHYLSLSKCALDLPEVDLGFDTDQLLSVLAHQPLLRLPGLRCLYFAHGVAQGRFYLNGEAVTLPAALAPVIPLVCDHQSLNHGLLAQWLHDTQFTTLLTQWVNRGYWYFDAVDEDTAGQT